MDEIFSPAKGVVGGNYFLVRRTHGKIKLIADQFRKLANLLRTPNRFFKTRFAGQLSKKKTENLLWAERERGILAQRQISIAYKRMEALTTDTGSLK